MPGSPITMTARLADICPRTFRTSTGVQIKRDGGDKRSAGLLVRLRREVKSLSFRKIDVSRVVYDVHKVHTPVRLRRHAKLRIQY